MKIGIQTWGSNGDIRPMVALADGLYKARHQVTLAVSSIDNNRYDDICRKLNIQYIHIPEQISFDLPDFARRTSRMNSLQWLNALLEEAFFPYEQIIYQTSQQLAEENDCLIGHHFLYPLKLAANKQQKPFISVTYCHAAVPVRSQPPFYFPNMGRLMNRLEWNLLNIAMDLSLKKRLGQLWLQEGMPDFKHIYSGLLTSDLLNLIAVDPLLCPRRQEWDPVHRCCGFLNLQDNAEDWEIPPELDEFLQQGEKPVYMTFGSLQQAVAEWSMDLFIEAAYISGCRAIIQTSSEQFPEHTRMDNIYFIGKHPHQPLFRHCAAVVHHGGAGTSHSATLCGCPSIVVPFMDEQLFWGRQLQNLNLAGKPLPTKKANARKLAERIQTVLNNKTMNDTADQIKQLIQQRHNGVENAVRMIENATASGHMPVHN